MNKKIAAMDPKEKPVSSMPCPGLVNESSSIHLDYKSYR
jgi:hypothetical protein